MKQLGFLFNADLCIGCRSCEAACINENGTENNVKWRRVIQTSENTFLSISCNHCDSPECFRVCPKKSYTKRRDGVVIIDPSQCDGCMICVAACPFDAPQLDYKQHKASKCNFCQTRQEQGKQPACIEACPTEAILMIDLTEKLPEGTVPTIAGFPEILLTKPSIRFVPNKPKKRYLL